MKTCRRAKIKLLAKKGIEGGEDIDNIPEGMRQYLGLQTMESGRPMGANFMGRDGLVSYRAGGMMGADQGPQGKVRKYHPSLYAVPLLRPFSHPPFPL